MFGLMRAPKCGLSADERRFRRLNYCGTCKTIGSLYSAKSRLLLNHDTVFLAEVLSSLSGENTADWQRSYQSFNCLNLPKGSIPASLGWAAAANVILAEFKIADHVADGEGVHYKIANRFYSKDFQKAQHYLIERDFPLDEVAAVLGSQASREAEPRSLDDLAFPTAQATAIFFREGIKQIGRGELAEAAFELGSVFGKLVYLMDAFEDFEKDLRRGQFNAFQAIYAITEKELAGQARRRIAADIAKLGREMGTKIEALPISENQRSLFVSRLSHNLGRKLGTELPVVLSKKVCAVKPKQGFSRRWRTAWEKAGELARGYSWQMPLVFGFVLVFALVAPAGQAKEARSARECFDLGFNLMFLGAMLGSVAALPKRFLMENPGPVQEAAKEAVKKGKGGGSSWCGGCGDDDCSCCCDCADCCECCTSCDC